MYSNEYKTCNKCKQYLPISEYSKHSGSNYLRPECKKCNYILAKKRTELRQKHGIPPRDYICPICQRPEHQIPTGGGKKSTRWVVDHNHETNKFRGWLCHNCNTALGAFRDSQEILERAIKYLNCDFIMELDMNTNDYKEELWRNARPEDILENPPMVARFKNSSTRKSNEWIVCKLYGWNSAHQFKWHSEFQSWDTCQVYDPASEPQQTD